MSKSPKVWIKAIIILMPLFILIFYKFWKLTKMREPYQKIFWIFFAFVFVIYLVDWSIKRIFNYRGVIIQESLEFADVLKDVDILDTQKEPVTEEDKTPWLKQWTMHQVEVPYGRIDSVVKKISASIDSQHANSWYVSLKNHNTHFVVFRGKIFKMKRGDMAQIAEAKKFGASLGIPDHQLDFSL